MSANQKLQVVLCWHMHQPEYRDPISHNYQLPWTYLHAIKDYIDMAAHLEAVPEAKAVVNFAPILLEQITDYSRQISGYLADGVAIQDMLLAALVDPVLPASAEKRFMLMKLCLRANEQRLIHRFPAYQKLATMAEHFGDNICVMDYVRDQYLVDLLVWYHLAWLGEMVRRQDKRIQALIDKAVDYTVHDRRVLLEVIGELLFNVIGRYKILAEKGQIELSVSPYAHPILPLLLDMEVAREAMPDVSLPGVTRYPGGDERVRWHVQQALTTFEKYFGFHPAGCWPSEGGISDATVKVLNEFGFRWVASGESVLRHSQKLRDKGKSESGSDLKNNLYQSYRFSGTNVSCFFRDDRLSDQIGFVYSDWHADDAVANMIHHLENIADAFSGQPGAIASIILDGENAWEHYPENGYYFLSALYKKLSAHPRLKLTTFSDYLKSANTGNTLNHIVSGSWVYGTFSTWIGQAEKNRGWEMLCDAKSAYDQVAKKGFPPERRLAAERQLAICEGSDWFWWFGPDNPANTVADFDQLYRSHLSRLYQLLHLEPPEYLTHAFSHGAGAPLHGGTMRPGQLPT